MSYFCNTKAKIHYVCYCRATQRNMWTACQKWVNFQMAWKQSHNSHCELDVGIRTLKLFDETVIVQQSTS